MIEITVADYLSRKIGIKAYMEEPDIRHTPSYIVVEKISGGADNHIQTATLAIQSYGITMYEAACTNEKVKNAMEEITELDEVSSAKLNSDYNYTDTQRKKYRYQAVYDFVYY
jgi:hypothetical protein